jgi:hypothetical protein
MELTGRVLWWSDRDQNGVIVDPSGNEFYFDCSVLNLKQRQVIKDEMIVIFNRNISVKDCPCAHNVRVPEASKKKSHQRKFERESFVEM